MHWQAILMRFYLTASALGGLGGASANDDVAAAHDREKRHLGSSATYGAHAAAMLPALRKRDDYDLFMTDMDAELPDDYQDPGHLGEVERGYTVFTIPQVVDGLDFAAEESEFNQHIITDHDNPNCPQQEGTGTDSYLLAQFVRDNLVLHMDTFNIVGDSFHELTTPNLQDARFHYQGVGDTIPQMITGAVQAGRNSGMIMFGRPMPNLDIANMEDPPEDADFEDVLGQRFTNVLFLNWYITLGGPNPCQRAHEPQKPSQLTFKNLLGLLQKCAAPDCERGFFGGGPSQIS